MNMNIDIELNSSSTMLRNNDHNLISQSLQKLKEKTNNKQLNSSLSMSSTIRSARRRIKSGSSVVLSTDTLLKYHKMEEDQRNVLNSSINKNYLISRRQDNSNTSIEDFGKNKKLQFIVKLKKWIRYIKERKNKNLLLKYIQFGKWNIKTSSLIFSLYLGFKLRKIMKSKDIKKCVTNQKDLFLVLNGLLQRNISTTNNEKTQDESYSGLHSLMNLTLLLSSHILNSLSVVDRSLVHSVIKQLLIERNNLHHLLFNNAKWQSFPAPGYWDIPLLSISSSFSGTRTITNIASRSISNDSANLMSPDRLGNNPPAIKRNITTPPHFNSASNKINLNSTSSYYINKQMRNDCIWEEDKQLEQSCSSISSGSKKVTPKSLKDILADKSSLQETNNISSIQFNSTNLIKSMSPDDNRPIRSEQISLLNQSNSNDVTISPISIKKRSSMRPHLQVDVLSADKLMPAKKGSTAKDVTGGTVPDRKPCLKVSLQLPSLNSSDGVMKKIYQGAKDFETVTLNPRWGSTFNISLPCNKQIIETILVSNGLATGRDIVDNELISTSDYDLICKELLDWWSLGVLNVEVFDGERFNEEIFLGYINILLNNFMVKVKKADELEIKGNYQLCKQSTNQRVSGTIKLHAYLHIPDRKYITEIVKQHLDENIGIDNNTNNLDDVNNNSLLDTEYTKEPTSLDINELKKLKLKLSNSKSDKAPKTSHLKLIRRHTLLSDETISKEIGDRKNDNSNSGSKVLKSNISRKNFIEDITKQLENLSDVQNSANDLLSNFQKILDSKKKKKNSDLNKKDEHYDEDIGNKNTSFESRDNEKKDGLNLMKELNMTRNFDEEDDIPLIDDNEFIDIEEYQPDNINDNINSNSKPVDHYNVNINSNNNHIEAVNNEDSMKYEYYSSGSEFEDDNEDEEFIYSKISHDQMINNNSNDEYLLGSDQHNDDLFLNEKNDFQLDDLSGFNITTDESHITEETSGYSMSSSLGEVMKSYTAKLLLSNMSTNKSKKVTSNKVVHKAFVVIDEDDL